MTAPLPGYQTIDPRYLYGEDRAIDFDIFVFRISQGQPTPVLLAGRETSISDLRSILAAKTGTIGLLYIKKEASPFFQRSMEDSLHQIIADQQTPLPKKSEIVYSCAKNVLQDVFTNPRSGENLARTEKVANNMVDLILTNERSILNLLSLGTHDYYTFTHCVNVAVFGLGLWLKIGRGNDFDLRDFTLGCILHDVGKTLVPEEILRKPGRLDAREFAEIQKHPQHGYDLMKESLSSPVSLDVILHHHEKVGGNGYPHGLRGDNISDHAKVAAIADVYDALTTNRPYCSARPPFNAILTMKEKMVGHFEQDKFVQFISFLGGGQG